jgi:hypothetical protein
MIGKLRGSNTPCIYALRTGEITHSYKILVETYCDKGLFICSEEDRK